MANDSMPAASGRICDDSAIGNGRGRTAVTMKTTMTTADGNAATAQAGTVPSVGEELSAAEVRGAIGDFIGMLEDAVRGNASVGFVVPLADGELEAFWHEVALDIDDRLRHVLVAREHGRIVGTVTLAPSMKPNQTHRAEVQKLLVTRAARGRGIGTALMQAVETLATGMDRWLLTLDTRATSDAERLYRRCGYVAIGAIPDYATDPDGQFAACTFFYKKLTRNTR
jgi:GNAT superfamily N-acetyltransferase